LQIELEYEDTVLIDFPAWLAHGIVPVAFALMAYRFTLSSIKRVMDIASPGSESEAP
jgi:TRAP-type C4-dicarboxylate transport system permease small subunit